MKENNYWPSALKEPWEVPANMSAAGHMRMGAVMGPQGIAALLHGLKK